MLNTVTGTWIAGEPWPFKMLLPLAAENELQLSELYRIIPLS